MINKSPSCVFSPACQMPGRTFLVCMILFLMRRQMLINVCLCKQASCCVNIESAVSRCAGDLFGFSGGD